jgi:hypothetical protein
MGRVDISVQSDPFDTPHEDRLVSIVMRSDDPAEVTCCCRFQIGQPEEAYPPSVRFMVGFEKIIPIKAIKTVEIAARDVIEAVKTAYIDSGTR